MTQDTIMVVAFCGLGVFIFLAYAVMECVSMRCETRLRVRAMELEREAEERRQP